jgi:hypothetical protein
MNNALILFKARTTHNDKPCRRTFLLTLSISSSFSFNILFISSSLVCRSAWSWRRNASSTARIFSIAELQNKTHRLEQIWYECKNIWQIRSRTVAVPYFAVTATVRCDWMRRTKTIGSHLNVLACRTVYVSGPLIRKSF